MPRQRIGYKIVRKDMTSQFEDMTPVRYKIGEPVVPRPGCGPLCVTTRRSTALYNAWPEDRVYKCRYVPSKFKKAWRSIPNLDGERITALDYLSVDTALAEQVTLIREVSRVHRH